MKSEERDQTGFLINDPLLLVDGEIHQIVGFEEDRQEKKLILIASESICPPAVREVLGSVFTNLYGEGYPSLRMTREERERLGDYERQHALFRRFGNRRFYKGTEYIDFVEALAQKRCGDIFATDSVRSEEIFVNVQPLSGAAANNAVYEAFLEPGDVVMGMDLSHGGHLTHGSEANRSGKRYRVVPYTVDPSTMRINYDLVRKQAMEVRPKMIIAGYSAYPWSVDWNAFREAADSVPGGCILLADIAHPAGLVVGGVFPNPVGIADVVSFTTHKTLCGPRGACLITTDPEKAARIDASVFPGEQGGPHFNNIAAKAVAFRIAGTERFKALMRKVVDNAKALAEALKVHGLKLAYGGTDTHMVLVDVREFKGPKSTPLSGEIASRILDLCGITCNKNTIPGDDNPMHPGAIRLATPWATQRGMGKEEMQRIAQLVFKVLSSIRPFGYIGVRNEIGRGKIDLAVIEEVRAEVGKLIQGAAKEPRRANISEVYSYWPKARKVRSTPLREIHERHGATLGEVEGWLTPLHFEGVKAEVDAARRSIGLFDWGDLGLIEVRGNRAKKFLNEVLTADIASMKLGESRRSFLLDGEARLIDDPIVFYRESLPGEGDSYLLLTHPENTEKVCKWLNALSDGYALFDPDDLFCKIQGPVLVEDLRSESLPSHRRLTAIALCGSKVLELLKKVELSCVELEEDRLTRISFEGIETLVLKRGGMPDGARCEFLVQPQRVARLWNLFLKEGKDLGIKMCGYEARIALREEYRLPGYGEGREAPEVNLLLKNHPSYFHLSKPYFVGRKRLLGKIPTKRRKRPYEFVPEEIPPRPSCLFEEHMKLTRERNIVSFAGWKMPVLYTSIVEEHRAVRTTAALFDVSHMGVIEVKGEGATSFLDLTASNYVPKALPGQALYSYLFYPDGAVVDDIMIYRRGPEKYMLVVNAVNAEKVFDWLNAVNSRRYVLDLENPGLEIERQVTIRNLKDPSSGDDQRVDIALQGPQSLAILKTLFSHPVVKRRVASLLRSEFLETEIENAPVLICRTGYTGEEFGYELYCHPQAAPRIWNLLLEHGKGFGLILAGLGARDSARTEAGLPLYGHELEGEHRIHPIEAGFGAFVRLHKPFFIGRKKAREKEANRTREIARFKMAAKGVKTVRPGDPVVDRTGQFMGNVTSAVLAEGIQMGLALIDRRIHREGARVGIFSLPRSGKVVQEKSKDQLSFGDRVLLHSEAILLTRFPEPEEMAERYRLFRGNSNERASS